MRQQEQELPRKTGPISEEVMQELRKKTFEELSDELFLMGNGKGQEDLMDAYVQLMQEKCPPDDGSFDFDAAMDTVKKRIAGQDSPCSTEYDFLQRLTVEELELLSKAGESNGEAESFLAAVQRETMSREGAEPAPNRVEAARNEKLPKEGPRKAKVFSFRAMRGAAAIVVVTVVLTLGCMVGAQASGLNVFGALAEWTADVFHFVPSFSGSDPVRNALREQDIPEELAPAWVPERFTLENVETLSNDEGNSTAAEYVGADGTLSIEIGKYKNPDPLADWDCQKDSEDAKPFISHERQFYIISNLECTTAIWSDGQSLIINIWGNVSTEEMMDIISSIGG